jgi:hypothetical protein
MNSLFEVGQPADLGFCPQRTQHLQGVLEAAVARRHSLGGSGRQVRAALDRPRTPPTVQDLLRHTAGLTYEILGTEPIQRLYAEADLWTRKKTNREFSQVLAALPDGVGRCRAGMRGVGGLTPV